MECRSVAARVRRSVLAGVCLTLVAAACGEASDTVESSATSAATDTTNASPVLSAPATVTETAEREPYEPIRIAWFGGSEIDLDRADVGRVSVGAAVGEQVATVDRSPVEIELHTTIAAMPEDVSAMLADAVAAGPPDAIVVSMNPAWLTWEQPHCRDIEDPYERYACVLGEQSAAVTERRHERLNQMIDDIEAAGVPALLYTMPHSTDSLSDDRLAPLIERAEQALAGFDPGVADIEFDPVVVNRGADPPYAEGVEFFDMVHPDPPGVERLAALLAPRVRHLASTS